MIELIDFKIEEFACKCGCGENKMQNEFLERLQSFRTEIGIPFRIDSGFRCKRHNKKVGGKPNSFHLKGRAADISIKAFSGLQLHEFLWHAFAAFNGVGVAKYYVHLDNRDTKASWVYPV